MGTRRGGLLLYLSPRTFPPARTFRAFPPHFSVVRDRTPGIDEKKHISLSVGIYEKTEAPSPPFFSYLLLGRYYRMVLFFGPTRCGTLSLPLPPLFVRVIQ